MLRSFYAADISSVSREIRFVHLLSVEPYILPYISRHGESPFGIPSQYWYRGVQSLFCIHLT